MRALHTWWAVPWRRVALAILAVCAGAAAGAAPPAGTLAQARARLDAAERQARQEYEQQRQACARQFVVAACVDRAREQRRVALDAIRSERVSLDALRRQERAQQRQERLRAKSAQAQARAAGASAPSGARSRRMDPSLAADGPVPLGGVRAAASPRSADGAASAASVILDAVPRDAALAAQRDRAARAALARVRRASEAEAHRESVMRREAQRARDKPAAAPLPVPAASN